jgi:hypothetical protein
MKKIEFEEQRSFIMIPTMEFESIKSLLELTYKEVKEMKSKTGLSSRWLGNQEVMQILQISPRTLQNMRDTRLLPFSKVQGKIYYKNKDIESLLENNYRK